MYIPPYPRANTTGHASLEPRTASCSSQGRTLEARPRSSPVSSDLSAATQGQSGKETAQFIRTRFKVEHALGARAEIHASTEPYFLLGGSCIVDNWRHTLGVKYEFAKGNNIDVFYIYRPDCAKSRSRTFHVIGPRVRREGRWEEEAAEEDQGEETILRLSAEP